MPSYFITGASRGIGFEFVQQLSENPDNVIVGLVRNKSLADIKIASEIPGRKNIFTIQGDLTDARSLTVSMNETSKITGGALDMLIANAGFIPDYSRFDPIHILGENIKELESDLNKSFAVNVVGNIHLFNIFLPLIKNGTIKKVVAITSGVSDMDLVADFQIDSGAAYAISKVGLNMVVAKFHAAFKNEGIIFMAICPGLVDTGHFDSITPEDQTKLALLGQKFAEYSPNMKGMAKVEESVYDVLKVISAAEMASNGGRTVSHFGTKQWL